MCTSKILRRQACVYKLKRHRFNDWICLLDPEPEPEPKNTVNRKMKFRFKLVHRNFAWRFESRSPWKRKKKKMSVQEYLDKHMLSRKIEDAVNAAVRAKTSDPVLFIVSFLRVSIYVCRSEIMLHYSLNLQLEKCRLIIWRKLYHLW